MLLMMNKTSINKMIKQKIYQYAESDSFWIEQNFACILFFSFVLTWLNVGFINPKYLTFEESYPNWVGFFLYQLLKDLTNGLAVESDLCLSSRGLDEEPVHEPETNTAQGT